MFFAASFVLGEVLVAHRRFFLYALAPLLYTSGIIAGTLLLGGRLGVAGAAVGAVAGAAAHLVVRSIGIARTPFRPRPRLAVGTPAFREFIRLMLPRMVSHPIDPLTVAFFTRLATGIGVGALTSYNYAADYQVVPVSLIGSAFSLAVFPSLAAAWNEGDGPTFRAVLRRNVLTIGALTFAAAIVLAILARPLIEIVHAGGRFDRCGRRPDGVRPRPVRDLDPVRQPGLSVVAGALRQPQHAAPGWRLDHRIRGPGRERLDPVREHRDRRDPDWLRPRDDREDRAAGPRGPAPAAAAAYGRGSVGMRTMNFPSRSA